jgi:hypothetical protein
MTAISGSLGTVAEFGPFADDRYFAGIAAVADSPAAFAATTAGVPSSLLAGFAAGFPAADPAASSLAYEVQRPLQRPC